MKHDNLVRAANLKPGTCVKTRDVWHEVVGAPQRRNNIIWIALKRLDGKQAYDRSYHLLDAPTLGLDMSAWYETKPKEPTP